MTTSIKIGTQNTTAESKIYTRPIEPDDGLILDTLSRTFFARKKYVPHVLGRGRTENDDLANAYAKNSNGYYPISWIVSDTQNCNIGIAVAEKIRGTEFEVSIFSATTEAYFEVLAKVLQELRNKYYAENPNAKKGTNSLTMYLCGDDNHVSEILNLRKNDKISIHAKEILYAFEVTISVNSSETSVHVRV